MGNIKSNGFIVRFRDNSTSSFKDMYGEFLNCDAKSNDSIINV